MDVQALTGKHRETMPATFFVIVSQCPSRKTALKDRGLTERFLCGLS